MIMNFQHLVRFGSNALSNNAPAILTAFGTVGVVTTAVLTGKASYEAAKKISDAEFVKHQKEGFDAPAFTKTEKVKLVWPLYISAVTSGVLTCGAVVMAHRISSRRAAVIAAAYALNEGKLEEYQEKIKEKFGIKEEKAARDDLAQDKVTRDAEDGTIVFNPMEGKVLIKDEYSGRYFYSTVEDINRAVNEINREVLNSMSSAATLSQFYDAIELEHVATSDHVGWNTNELCEIDWSTCTTPSKREAVHVFDFVNPPVLNPGANNSFR